MMEHHGHILLVDTEEETLDTLRAYLGEEGFEVSLARDGDEMRHAMARSPVHLVILDVRLAHDDGLFLAGELRRSSDAGIIILTRKDELADRVAGLEIGADDYIAKPVHMRELLARVRSVLRRRDHSSSHVNGAPTGVSRPIARFGRFRLDPSARTLSDLDGNEIELTTGELNLLLAFVDNPRSVLSRNQLMDHLHGGEIEAFDRSIDVQVGRLRRKIESNPRHPELITTIRGVGYMLDCDVHTE